MPDLVDSSSDSSSDEEYYECELHHTRARDGDASFASASEDRRPADVLEFTDASMDGGLTDVPRLTSASIVADVLRYTSATRKKMVC